MINIPIHLNAIGQRDANVLMIEYCAHMKIFTSEVEEIMRAFENRVFGPA